MANNYNHVQEIDDVQREILLKDIENAEALAKTYLSDAKGKLLMGTDYRSFGGLNSPTGASAASLGEMHQKEKSVWVASRLWAVCQKIRSDKNPGAAAGQELVRYKNWLKELESHRAKSSAGGKSKREYSDALNSLIEGIILTVSSLDHGTIKKEVFRKLPGKKLDVIESIELQEDKLLVSWFSRDARRPERSELLGKSAISKRVTMIISRT